MPTPRTTIRTYSEMIKYDRFIDRYRYLRLADGKVGEDTFGYQRYLNQIFYHDRNAWGAIRREVILRDNGCDLGVPGREIQVEDTPEERKHNKLYVHHMNPIAVVDLMERSEYLLVPEYLVCCSKRTHDAIHYGDESLLWGDAVPERTINDTCPWRK